jgi:hypothetical protein
MESEITNSIIEHDQELVINADGRTYLNIASKWAKLLAVLGFIGTGFMVLAGIIMAVVTSFTSRLGSPFGLPMGLLGLLYILMAALYFFPAYYLYNFASKTKIALDSINQSEFDSSLKNLKKMFKFLGIMTVALIAAYIIAIPTILIFSFSKGMVH